MAVIEQKKSVCAHRAAVQTAEKRRSEVRRRFAAQFVEKEPKISSRWEKAIKTYNNVKSETVAR
jgi:hypothetical protein